MVLVVLMVKAPSILVAAAGGLTVLLGSLVTDRAGRGGRSRCRPAGRRRGRSRPGRRARGRCSARMTVPSAAEGCSASWVGRQWVTLQPYIIRSTSSPGAVNVSATRSSTTSTVPPGASAARAARSASTGRAMSCSASRMRIRSYGPWPASSARVGLRGSARARRGRRRRRGGGRRRSRRRRRRARRPRR